MENGFELSILLWLIAKKISVLADNVWQTRHGPKHFKYIHSHDLLCPPLIWVFYKNLKFYFIKYQLGHIYNNFLEN